MLSNDLPRDLLHAIDRRRAEITAAMERHGVFGAAIALVYKNKVAWTEGFGITDPASQQSVDAGTIFSIQSISKNFTATAIMLAVQEGLLDLNQPITAYLPNFRVHSRFEDAPQKKMTLRLLLSHRAGFTHEAPIGNNYYPAFPDFEAHIRSISETWLRYPVGERYSYSNLGIDLAGYILQSVTGVPFADCVKSTLLDPLELTDTTFSSQVYAERTNRAIGHEPGHTTVPLITPLIPSGGVYTSVTDMGKYALFHLNKGLLGGTQLLDKNLWEEMHSVQSGGHYGLGVTRWKVRYGDNVLDLFNHNGGGFGFGSTFTFYPEAETAWVALFNNEKAPYDKFDDSLVRNEILSAIYGAQNPILLQKNLNAVLVPNTVLERYIGNYVTSGERRLEFSFAHKTFGFRDFGTDNADHFHRLLFTSETDAYFTGKSTLSPSHPVEIAEAHALRFDTTRRGESGRVEWPDGPSDLDYNDGPNDVPGPNKKDWAQYLGDYEVTVWGKVSQKRTVHMKNGYLYIDALRMIAETQRGLFFASNGEALDFRSKPATLANIPLEKL